ncbi:hypothetical protein ACNI3K_11365 [Demequina sp. SO4-13]|uniref:hypothetical protein n=1 Tax=Demequina sp. SO4-13 TaxID=3401027 RepID=UPI003AF8D04E
MGTDDNLKKAKDQPAVVADDKLDEAAERIAEDTSDADDDTPSEVPGESSEHGKG